MEWLLKHQEITIPAVPRKPVVYLLLNKEGKVVYVGESISPLPRFVSHINDKEFSTVRFLDAPLDNRERKHVESSFMWYFQPKYNQRGNGTIKYSAPSNDVDFLQTCTRYELPPLTTEYYQTAVIRSQEPSVLRKPTLRRILSGECPVTDQTIDDKEAREIAISQKKHEVKSKRSSYIQDLIWIVNNTDRKTMENRSIKVQAEGELRRLGVTLVGKSPRMKAS